MAKRTQDPLSILSSFQAEIKKVLKELQPKPDDPNSKTPCSKCVGSKCGCSIMYKRKTKKECNTFASNQTGIIVEYNDGSKVVIGKERRK